MIGNDFLLIRAEQKVLMYAMTRKILAGTEQKKIMEQNTFYF